MKKESEIGKLVKPTKNRMLIRIIEEDGMLANGIIKPESQIESEVYCDIVAIGPQVIDIKPGDLGIMRLNISADTFKLEGKKYAIVTDFDITAIIDPVVKDMFKRKNVQSNVREEPLSE
jgi:co-chaperonin GroES (HSP10)